MSAEAVSAVALPDLALHHETETEAEMLRTLGSILLHGSFSTEEIEMLASAASDSNIDAAARCFAGQSLRWLAQQPEMMTTPIWSRNGDAHH